MSVLELGARSDAGSPGAGSSDAALVAAVRAGSREAADVLYARHVEQVRAVCRRRLSSDHDVADACQETFARALTQLDQLRDAERFGAWTRAIAARVCADVHRDDGRTLAAEGLVDVAAVSADGPAEQVERAEQARVVRAQLATLGDRDRQALWMRDAVGMPVADVAEHLELTQGAARVLLARARRRLRAAWVGLVAVLLVARGAVRERIGRLLPQGETAAAAVATQAAVVAAVAFLPVTPGPPEAGPVGPSGPGPSSTAAPAVSHPARGGPPAGVATAHPASPALRAPATDGSGDRDPAGGARSPVGVTPRVGDEPPEGEDPAVTAEADGRDGTLAEVDVFAGDVTDAVADRGSDDDEQTDVTGGSDDGEPADDTDGPEGATDGDQENDTGGDPENDTDGDPEGDEVTVGPLQVGVG